MGVWDHVKNGGDYSASHWALDWFGFLPGKRESCRFIGQTILTQNDLIGSVPFHDTIAFGGWPLDLHPPEGIDKPDERPCTQTHLPYLYDIPLRACVARDIGNLMFAGRNISATHVAFASTRVMATCAAMGEGVGVAAAVACEKGMDPARLGADAETLREIQRRLLKEDVFLIDRGLPDESDFALKARISASSESALGLCQNVVSPQNRALDACRGVPEGRYRPGTHRWMSDPGAGFPAWIELRWPAPVPAREIRLVFDTGLHRHLTLTQSEEYLALMEWKEGQPETVRDYRLEVEREGEWGTLVTVEGNWQRRAVHPVAGEITALRLVVFASWGIDHARVVRVAVYC